MAPHYKIASSPKTSLTDTACGGYMNFIKLCSFGLALLCGPGLTSAQEPQPSETPKHEPTGYIRIWDFAGTIKIPIQVSLTGGPTPLILAYSMSSGRVASYRPVPPGKYKLSIHAVP